MSQPQKEHASEESIVKSSALLTKQVSKLWSQFHKHIGNYRNQNNWNFNTSSSYFNSSSSSNNNSGFNKRRENERGDRASWFSKSDRNVRCHEYEDFGHYQIECATFLKRKKKSLATVTFSDDEVSVRILTLI